MVHPYNRILSTVKRNDFLSHKIILRKPERKFLRERIQSEKATWYIILTAGHSRKDKTIYIVAARGSVGGV